MHFLVFDRSNKNGVCRRASWLLSTLVFLLGFCIPSSTPALGQEATTTAATSPWLVRPSGTVRFATFNVAMNRERDGQLLEDLETGNNAQAKQVAEILQRVRPDVVLLCELDRDPQGKSLEVFCDKYLQQPQNDQEPIKYTFRFFAPSNTGIDSGIDLDGNGKTGEANDAFGFGQFPGQYAMAVLSRFPIDKQQVRTFQKFVWIDMPEAHWPQNPDTKQDYYPPESKDLFRLSSKSHWAIPMQTPQGTMYFVTAHPTPPVFDGPEDRNGLRNHDEIRLIADLVDPERGKYVVDDRGLAGGLPAGSKFVIAGDLNADPNDGDSSLSAIDQLLSHPLLQTNSVPASEGAREASAQQGGVNLEHQGPARYDTSDFNDQRVGNLRLDYVLPSRNLDVESCGVFWPKAGQPGAGLIEASDHRLVWVDVK